MTVPNTTTASSGLAKVVLFDLDGTLTDPSGDFLVSIRHALSMVGVPAPGDKELLAYLGPPLPVTLAALGVPDHETAAATSAYRTRYESERSAGTRVHDGIPALLADLRHLGCRLGVATSKPRIIAEQVLSEVGLRDALDTVAGATLSEQHATKREVIAEALAQNGDPKPSDVVMVGDRIYDIEGARAHGIDAVAVSWGFAQPGEIAGSGARAVVADVAALRDELGIAHPTTR